MGDFDPYASMAEWQRGVVEPFAQMSAFPGTVLFTFALGRPSRWAPSSSSYPGRRSRTCTRSSPVRRRFVATKSQSCTWIELRTPGEEFVQRDRAYPRDLAPDDPSDDPSKRTKEPTQSRNILSRALTLSPR